MDFTPLSKWIPNLTRPMIVAGPCSAETEEQVLQIAHELKNIKDVKIFRAGIWKPRTRPNCFEGVGEIGLSWLKKVKEETGLLVSTEVANAKHVELALKYDIDILWIGARTTVNPFSVQEIADALKGTNIPVMVKNPINADLALWIGSIERLYNAGITKIVAIHRGFSSAEKSKYRNHPHWNIPMELKRRFPNLPIICDPSHITGKRDLVGNVMQKAMDVDMDGVMVETHNFPDKALSDAAQQITPGTLQKIINNLSLKTEFTTNRSVEEKLDLLRSQIDRIDREILEGLQMRMDIVKKIGTAKAQNNITALQVNRMDKMINDRLELAGNLGLSEKYAKELFNVIHTESVKNQTDIMIDFQNDTKQ